MMKKTSGIITDIPLSLLFCDFTMGRVTTLTINHARTARDVSPTPSDDFDRIKDPIENQGGGKSLSLFRKKYQNMRFRALIDR